jgi:hypothetical protein
MRDASVAPVDAAVSAVEPAAVKAAAAPLTAAVLTASPAVRAAAGEAVPSSCPAPSISSVAEGPWVCAPAALDKASSGAPWPAPAFATSLASAAACTKPETVAADGKLVVPGGGTVTGGDATTGGEAAIVGDCTTAGDAGIGVDIATGGDGAAAIGGEGGVRGGEGGVRGGEGGVRGGERLPVSGKAAPLVSGLGARDCSVLRVTFPAAARSAPAKSCTAALPLSGLAGAGIDCAGSFFTAGAMTAWIVGFMPWN